MTVPLNPVVANEDGTGSATTTIDDVTLAELFGADEERFILLHARTEEGQGVPPGISCADMVPTADNGGLDTLPASGGTPPTVLLSVVALSALSAAAALLVLWRRLA